MSGRKLEGEELRVFLVNNWMTHDAIWYGEAAARFGMAEASPEPAGVQIPGEC